MEELLILAYTVWAIYSGYKVVTGRSEWLDRRAPLNMAVKAILSLLVGYVVAVFYLMYMIVKFINFMNKNIF